MTLNDALTKFDAEICNDVPEEVKIKWLSTLDMSIYKDIILTHVNPHPDSFVGYTDTTDKNTELLVPDPHSELYFHYLAMKKDLYFSDIQKYNNNLMLYSASYREFENFYNRNNMPLKKTDFFNA